MREIRFDDVDALNADRFMAPVPAGSAVHARTRLVRAEARPKGTLVTSEVEVAVVGQDRPSLLYVMQILYMG